MGSRGRALGVVVGASAIAFGCNLLTGASDLTIGGGTALGDGGATESGAPRIDGGKLASTCVAAGGCAGVCLHDKEGWRPLVLPLAGGACPPDYRTMETVAAADPTNDTCTCACAPKKGSCEGPLSLYTGNDTTCTQGPTTVSFPPDGGCLPVPNLDAPRVRMTLAGNAPSDCEPIATESFGPLLSLATCTGATATTSSDCDGNGCYPAPPPGAKACVVHEGETSCPRGYDLRILAGSDAEDSRSCGSCSCVDEGCKDAKVQQYLDDKCTLPVSTLPLDECRAQVAGLVKGASYKPPSGCRAVTPAGGGVTGKVTFERARTICCAL